VNDQRILVLGANGQLGKALQKEFPQATFWARDEFDLTDQSAYLSITAADVDIVINAAAYTAVDAAETPEGHAAAMLANATAVGWLADRCRVEGITLVHVSSDYVFDGTSPRPYTETDPMGAIGAYGLSKQLGDEAATTAPQHYVVRSSWVIGEGNNFVRTMASLADKGVDPNVVNDQTGRLTFTADMARGIRHLLETNAPYGVYNLSNEGEPATWCDIAQRVYELTGHDPQRVSGISTDEYFARKEGIAPRPANSMLDLTKIEATGFTPPTWDERLKEYLAYSIST